MKNKLILTLSLVMVCVTVSAQFADTDTLRRYNNRWITNNSGTAFTNLRLHTLLEGMIDFIDTALNEAGGSFSGIDSVAALNDSTIRYRKNGVFRSFKLRGNHWNLQNILNHGSTLTENETITLLDSLRFELGKIILDTLRIRHLQEVNDTTLYKPVVKDISGNLYAFDRWPGAATLENAAGSGDTLLVGPTTIKRLDHDQTITFSINANKILIAVDTPNYISTHSKLRDTAAVLRGLIGAGNTSSQGIRKNVNNFELGDIAGENFTTFTTDRFLRGGNRSIYLTGNKTNFGVANIIFDDTLTATAGNPRFKTWMQFNSPNHVSAPFILGSANVEDGTGFINHVGNWGFNLSPANTRIDANYCAFGFSFEGNYQGLQEAHLIWIDKFNTQYRLFSYTLDTTTKDIDFYHTVDRFYLKQPSTGNVYLYTQGGVVPTLRLYNSSGTNYVGLAHSSVGSGSATLSANATLDEFHLSNFNNWFFPGLTFTSNYLKAASIAGFIIGTDPAAPDLFNITGAGNVNGNGHIYINGTNGNQSGIVVENQSTGHGFIQLKAKTASDAVPFVSLVDQDNAANSGGMFLERTTTIIPTTAVNDFVVNNTTSGKSLVFATNPGAGRVEGMRLTSSSRVGIGVTSPTAVVHIKAGTATANTAPLKLTSGTNLTTPEDGAIEYNGTHFYGTIGSTRYQLDQQAGGTTFDQSTANGNALTTNRIIDLATFDFNIKDGATDILGIGPSDVFSFADLTAGSQFFLTPANVTTVTTEVTTKLLMNNSTGEVIKAVEPKNYTALLTQAGTSDPTAIVLGSNTVGSIAWARTGTGVYTGTLSGAFTVDKTWLNVHLSDQSGGTIIIAKLVRTDANTITLSTFNSLLVATDVFTQISIEVKVYP